LPYYNVPYLDSGQLEFTTGDEILSWDGYIANMELPLALTSTIDASLEFIYSLKTYATPTVILGEFSREDES
jgi:hypothetical protein